MVIEVVQSAISAAALQEWSIGNDYNLMRTDPSHLAEMDYGSDQQFLGYPTLPLIDLDTMTIVETDCYNATPPSYMGYETLKVCVENHL